MTEFQLIIAWNRSVLKGGRDSGNAELGHEIQDMGIGGLECKEEDRKRKDGILHDVGLDYLSARLPDKKWKQCRENVETIFSEVEETCREWSQSYK